MEEWEPSHIIGWIVKWYSHFRKVWHFLKHTLLQNIIILFLHVYLEKVKTFFSPKDLHTNVHNSLFCYSSKLETTHMLVDKDWINTLLSSLRVYIIWFYYIHLLKMQTNLSWHSGPMVALGQGESGWWAGGTRLKSAKRKPLGKGLYSPSWSWW